MATDKTNQTIKLKDGRTLGYAEYGDLQGHPVFFFHGGPGSRLEASLYNEGGLKHGFRIIATDRPGHGLSDYQKGRKLLNWPNDVLELAQHLGLSKFGIMGWSAGGPSALACFYAIPEHLTFAISLASAGSATWEGAFDNMHKADRFSARLALRMPSLVSLFMAPLGFYAKHFLKSYLQMVINNLNESDQKLFDIQTVAEIMGTDAQEAYRHGSRGPTQDAVLIFRDWGFRLEEIMIPVHVWHATKDTMVAYKIGEHIAKTIPNAILNTIRGEGHFFPITRIDEILEMAKSELRKNQIKET